MSKEAKNSPAVFRGVLLALVVFVLLFSGVRGILGNPVDAGNLLAYGGFSLLTGLLATLMIRFSLGLALKIFLAGLGIGFVEMYRAFIRGMGGWGDLIGVLSLMIFAAAGLVLGLTAQGILALWRRRKH